MDSKNSQSIIGNLPQNINQGHGSMMSQQVQQNKILVELNKQAAGTPQPKAAPDSKRKGMTKFYLNENE